LKVGCGRFFLKSSHRRDPLVVMALSACRSRRHCAHVEGPLTDERDAHARIGDNGAKVASSGLLHRDPFSGGLATLTHGVSKIGCRFAPSRILANARTRARSALLCVGRGGEQAGGAFWRSSLATRSASVTAVSKSLLTGCFIRTSPGKAQVGRGSHPLLNGSAIIY
jgi:hypothetical protein